MQLRYYKGLSLIEIMFATAIISVAVIGSISYRYYTALDGRRANNQATASRVALLLCESWKGTNGSQTYDPSEHLSSGELTIVDSDGPQAPEDFTELGSYMLGVNSITCYATLSFKDIDTGLRALNVIVAWQQRDKAGNGLDDMDKLFELTTYVIN